MTRLLYIGGLGRSGSTLIERVLSQDPHVCSVGEFYSLWQRLGDADALCGCQRPLAECPVWQGVLPDRLDAAGVYALQQRVDRTRYLPLLLLPRLWPPFSRRLRRYVGLLAALYASLAENAASTTVVDSSKRPANALLLRLVPGIEMRVVHLVRDSRGVAYSWSKHVEMEPRRASPLMSRYRPAHITARWVMYNWLFAALRLVGVPVLRVHYEDFLADPIATVRRIETFAGLGGADRQVIAASAVRLDRTSHTVTGNPVRFRSGDVRLARDDEWRTALPRRHRRVVELVSAGQLLRYGYLVGGRRPR